MAITATTADTESTLSGMPLAATVKAETLTLHCQGGALSKSDCLHTMGYNGRALHFPFLVGTAASIWCSLCSAPDDTKV